MDRPYVIWAGQGDAGSGKSHFLMTAPEPVFVQVINDPGGIKKLKSKPEFRKRDIRWKEYSFNLALIPDEDRAKVAEDLVGEFLDHYRNLGLANARTIGWDKEDLFYEMLRYARYGDLKADRPTSYRVTNDEYRGIIQEAAEAGVNLGLLRAMKEKWGLTKDGKLGGLGYDVARGQREVSEMAEVVLHHYWDDEVRKFKVRIGGNETDAPKLRVGPVEDLIGKEFEDFGFINLAVELYPEIPLEDWGL